MEVPLLFERGFAQNFDKIIVITRAKEERINSVKERSHLSEEEILSRIDKQIDYDKFDFTPYIVIKNDGTKEDLAAAVIKAIEE